MRFWARILVEEYSIDECFADLTGMRGVNHLSYVQMAERIKHEIGSAYPGQEVREISVKGRNLSEGVPRSFTLNSNEILEALQEPLQGIVGAVKLALEQTPPELGADVAERGIVLTGGGALLTDIDKLLTEETGLPVVIADDPLTCVARGTGVVLQQLTIPSMERVLVADTYLRPPR